MQKKYPILFLASSICIITFGFQLTALAATTNNKILSEIENFSPEKQYSPETDLNITNTTLEIGKIKILPDNMFYFLNNIREWFASSFAVNKDNKIQSSFKISSEKIIELKKCVELSAEKCVENSITNYTESKNTVYSQTNQLDNAKKNSITESIVDLEINHFILLNELRNDYPEQKDNINVLIENNLQNLSKFIKSISDNITLKKNIKLAIENSDKSKLKYIPINQYLSTFKNYLNIEKRDLIDQIISENNTELIKNINLININNLENTLQYYFYKINYNTIFEEIAVIDNIYKLQENVVNSPNAENIKIAILNIKQIPVNILNTKIEQIENNSKAEEQLSTIFNLDEINNANLIELINKYNNGKKNIKTYLLNEIENKNLKSLYQKINSTTDLTQKEKLINSTLDQISPENKSLASQILDTLELNNTEDLNTKAIIDRIKEQRNINTTTTSEDNESITICSKIYSPVCGSDNTTYNNKCLANQIGITIAYNGECKILENSSLKRITDEEITKGWYYGDKTQKKPGTPTTWVNVDSDTKNAKWINPKQITGLKGIIE